MKTFKPQKLGVLTRCFENDGQPYFVVSVLAFFALDPPEAGPARLLSEVAMWTLAMEELGKGGVLDEAMSKERGEVVVIGRAYPRNPPQPACKVRVTVGPIDKALRVAGDRRWDGQAPSGATPFSEMPLTYEHAYGGEGYAHNPVGKGHPGVVPRPLPNVEEPGALLSSPDQVPERPAGLRAYDPSWPQRQSKTGTFDEAWRKERAPGLPADFDWGFYNVAPADQRLAEGYFQGDEPIRLENLHPTDGEIISRLPGIAARVFINSAGEGEPELVEVKTRLDTVILLPHHRRGVVVFRGVTKVKEDDARDVRHLLLAAETLGEPRPLSHYRDALLRRLDKQQGAVNILRDRDFLPAHAVDGNPMPTDPATAKAPFEGLMADHARRRAQAELDAMREKLVAQGIDPDERGVPREIPAPEPGPDLEHLDTYLADKRKEADAEQLRAEQMRTEVEARARAICEQQGIDFDARVTEARKASAGPPRFSADDELDKLRAQLQLARNAGTSLPLAEATLADPQVESRLRAAERHMRDTYRRTAHHGEPAGRLEPEASARVRAEIQADHAAGRSLDDRDLTGADLSGLALRNASLRGALLEGANLSGADLSGADLSEAVLARADLTGAKLVEAQLVGTNLGAARLTDADLSRAELDGTILARADLTGTVLRDARLKQPDLTEVVVAGADFSGAQAEGLVVVDTDLSGARFVGARLTRGAMVRVKLGGADFSEASIERTSLVTVEGKGVIFRRARLPGLSVVMGSSLPGADFSEAEMPRANLRGCVLRGASFRGAQMDGADLSECDLHGGQLQGVRAREAMLSRTDLTKADLTRADLLGALMPKANLCGANFTGANLFRADLSRARGDADTVLEGTNQKHIRLVGKGVDVSR